MGPKARFDFVRDGVRIGPNNRAVRPGQAQPFPPPLSSYSNVACRSTRALGRPCRRVALACEGFPEEDETMKLECMEAAAIDSAAPSFPGRGVEGPVNRRGGRTGALLCVLSVCCMRVQVCTRQDRKPPKRPRPALSRLLFTIAKPR